MSISFNVLSYLLNMKGGGWGYIRRPPNLPVEEFVIKGRSKQNMRPLGLLAFALNASALLLLAQGSQRGKDGLYTASPPRLSASDRPIGYHLPTYMMHLYRNFRSNFSRPLDTLEQSAAQQADTVQSVVAKSKILFHLFPPFNISYGCNRIDKKKTNTRAFMTSSFSCALCSCLAQVTLCQGCGSQTTTEGLNPHLTPRLTSLGGLESPWMDQRVKFSV